MRFKYHYLKYSTRLLYCLNFINLFVGRAHCSIVIPTKQGFVMFKIMVKRSGKQAESNQLSTILIGTIGPSVPHLDTITTSTYMIDKYS